MNFLSHHYIIHKDARPYYSLGNILPDLTRIVHKDFRISTEIHLNTRDNKIQEIVDGAKFHHYADSVFHNSSFFKQNDTFILKRLKSLNLESIDKYLYFLSHIMLEIILDRILVKRDPHVCDHFYESLKQVKYTVIGTFFDQIGKGEYSEKFQQFFEHFKAEQYLREYVHNESVIFALNKVYQRIIDIEFTAEDKKKINDIIPEIEAHIEPHYPKMFTF